MSPSPPDKSETIDLAKKTGQKIFGICVDVVEEESVNPMGPARYDYRRDRICLFPSFINKFYEEHDDNQALIIYTICHEIGHASETRSFERGLLFPYGLNISNNLSTHLKSRFGISES